METAPPRAAETTPATPGALTLVDIRRLWPDVIDRAKSARRLTWIHLSQNSQVVGFDNNTITLGFTNAGARNSFEGGSADIVRQLVIDVIGAEVRIETVVDPGADPNANAPGGGFQVTQPATQPEAAPPAAPPATDTEPPPWATDEPAPERPSGAEQARRALVEEVQAQEQAPRVDPDEAASLDDADVDAESGTDLLARELGAKMIEEIPHS